MANLESVFLLSGVPTLTFVPPQRYSEIKVSVRTPGRCLVIEGPSGIGKTTTITRLLEELNLIDDAMTLSARDQNDLELIKELPDLGDIGIVMVDDFHRLDLAVKEKLADFMKKLADTGTTSSKLILVGINNTGQQLVRFSRDLGLRIDVFKMESNPTELLEQVIELGEKALNVTFENKTEIAVKAHGSFQLTQMLCNKLCILDGVSETRALKHKIKTSINVAVETVFVELSRMFKDIVISFARGYRLRKEGRAPYLHILRWLSEMDEWSIQLTTAQTTHPEMKESINQVLVNNWLSTLLNKPNSQFESCFHFEKTTSILSIEDPNLMFYLKNINWRVFTKDVGYENVNFKYRYDFALSFAGSNRELAKKLYESLTEREVSVFYDNSEQYRIITQNVEDYLAPIYRSEAGYIIAILSPDYPSKIWTKFESEAFRARFGKNEVIPIRFTTTTTEFFTDDAKYGGLPFDPSGDIDAQVNKFTEILCMRLAEDRNSILTPD